MDEDAVGRGNCLSLEHIPPDSGAIRRLVGTLWPILRTPESHASAGLDLQGSKWRLGLLEALELREGQTVTLLPEAGPCDGSCLPVPHADFFRAAHSSGSTLWINDAKVKAEIISIKSGCITARITRGGPVSAHKGITYAETSHRLDAMREKDREILKRTGGYPWVRYAISYIRDEHEMAMYRAEAGSRAYLIAKLERGSALAAVEAVAAKAQELWLCRGDLGAEMGLAPMAETAYQFTGQVKSLPIPSFLAGQVLEHMASNPTPTRSEIYTLYDALQHGYRGFVLSDETAVGQFPVESIRIASIFRQQK